MNSVIRHGTQHEDKPKVLTLNNNPLLLLPDRWMDGMSLPTRIEKDSLFVFFFLVSTHTHTHIGVVTFFVETLDKQHKVKPIEYLE